MGPSVPGHLRLEAAKIAPLISRLLSAAASHVTGQIFGVRNNNLSVFTARGPFARRMTELVGL